MRLIVIRQLIAMELSIAYETVSRLLLLWACISPVLIIAQAVLAFTIWQRGGKQISQLVTTNDQKIKRLQKQYSETLENAELNQKVAETFSLSLQRELELLKIDHLNYARRDWLNHLGGLAFANEVEVEIKFIYPLLLHLGYQDDDFSIRYKANMQAGRDLLQKEADWVIWRRGAKNTKAVIVVEAKAPGQALDNLVQGQARSYAFAVNAPLYILTNGRDIQVYRRGIEDDACIFISTVSALKSKWDDLDAVVSAQKIKAG